MDFIETSAKGNRNVREAFVKLATEICELKAQQAPQTLPVYEEASSLSLTRDSRPVDKESSGCAC